MDHRSTGSTGLGTTTLVVADDHPLMLNALEHLFAQEPDLQVLARCTNGQETIAATRRYSPDVLLLDLHMPDMSGIEVVRELKDELDGTRVVMFTSKADEREVLECLHLRVPGIVLKSMAPHLIVQCVRKVAAGDVWLEKDSFSRTLELLLRRQEGIQNLSARLSSREIQVVTLCAQGLSNQEIAARLFVGQGTVKTHLHNVYRKLGVKNRAALVELARKNGVI